MDATAVGRTTAPAEITSPPVVTAPAPVEQVRMEAPPFEGTLQRDAFARPADAGDDALRLFVELVRELVPLHAGTSLTVIASDPSLSSPLGG